MPQKWYIGLNYAYIFTRADKTFLFKNFLSKMNLCICGKTFKNELRFRNEPFQMLFNVCVCVLPKNICCIHNGFICLLQKKIVNFIHNEDKSWIRKKETQIKKP